MGAVRHAGAQPRGSLNALAGRAEPPPWRGGWDLRRRCAPASELVRPPVDVDGRVVCIYRPTDRAVVLGSTQRPRDVDGASIRRGGFSLSERRSGGGAVVVAPAAQVWVDLFVPRGDPIFDDDVARAAFFVADLWVAALERSGEVRASLEPIRAFQPTRWSRLVCYSGLGPGEVTLAGRKVVGVSQRRDRTGAWFFTMALLNNAQRALADFVVLEASDRAQLSVDLTACVGASSARAEVIEAAIVRELGGG